MSIGDLSSKLKDRIQQERQTLEQIAQNEFETFQRNLSESSKNALTTIEADIAEKAKTMSKSLGDQLANLESRIQPLMKALFKTWLRNLLLSVSLILGLGLGSWGLGTVATVYLDSLRKDISELQQRKADLKQTVSNLDQKIWGVEFLETKDGRFIVLQKGTTATTGWKRGDQKAIKLEQ